MLRHPPDILITTPESLYLLLTSQGREMLASVETLIVDEVHAVAGTKRGAHLALSPGAPRAPAGQADAAHRAVRNAAPDGGDRPLRRRRAPDPARRRRRAQGARPPRHRPGRGPARAALERRPLLPGAGGRAGDGRRHGARRPLDLAVDLPGAPPPRRGAPLDDRLRQQPPPRRATRAPAQRARREAGRARPPRLARARAAGRDRGAAEARRDPLPRRDVEPRARHRHGRRRPRRPGREPEIRRARAAADRTCGPRARRRLEGPHLPEVPRRPARVGRGRPAHAGGRDRGDGDPAQPARRARAADRRDRGGGGDRRRRPPRARPGRVPVRRPLAPAARERPRHARRPLSL